MPAIFSVTFLCLDGSALFSMEPEKATTMKYATLKFDDLTPREGPEAVTGIEQAVYTMLMEEGIPHAWGVCRLSEAENPAFYQWLQQRDAEGIEIWHHGNRHDRIEGESWEFRNRDMASQLENLRFTQEKVLDKAGIVLQTFGAPFNKTDLATGQALNEIHELKIIFFGQESPNFDGLFLNERVNLESRTGVVATIEDFKASYDKRRDAEIIVLQGHPAYWDADADLPKLDAILEFLKAEGRKFITPRDFYRLTRNSHKQGKQ